MAGIFVHSVDQNPLPAFRILVEFPQLSWALALTNSKSVGLRKFRHP